MYTNEDLLSLLDHDHIKMRRIKDIIIENQPEIVIHKTCFKSGCFEPAEKRVYIEFDDLAPIILKLIKELKSE